MGGGSHIINNNNNSNNNNNNKAKATYAQEMAHCEKETSLA